MTGDARRLLDALEGRLRAVTCAWRRALWDGDERVAAAAEDERAAIFGDRAARDAVAALAAERSGDDEVDRRAALLGDEFARAAVDLVPELRRTAALLARRRAGAEPAGAGALATLRDEPDRGRRERAWRARAAVGAALAPALRDLARRRDQAARALGHASHHALRLATAGLDAGELEALVDDAEAATDEPWRRSVDARRAALGVDALAPWDLYLDPSGFEAAAGPRLARARAVPALERTVAAMGLDLGRVTLRVLEGAARATALLCDPPRDVRLEAAIGDGAAGWRDLFHEAGHALYACGYATDLPWIFGEAAAGVAHEAVAQLFAGWLDDPEWQREIAGLPEDVVALGASRRRDEALVVARFRIVLCRFERALGEGAVEDPTELWWRLVERIVGVAPVPGTAPWARIPHFITHPGIHASYLYGDVVAAQLAAHSSAATGRWLVELFRDGARHDWRALVRRATGDPLNIRSWLGVFHT